MKLKETDIKELGAVTYKRSKNQEIIEEFINSGMQCAEIENYAHATAESCVNSFAKSIKHFSYHGVKARQRGNRVYLIKIT